MLLSTYFIVLSILGYEVKMLFCLELTPLEKWNPNVMSYSQPPKVNDINLGSFLFKCQNCFVLLSLFNNVDISYSYTPVFIAQLFPVGLKNLPDNFGFVPLGLFTKIKSNGSLIISSFNQSNICSSKLFNISDTICTHINVDKFVVKTKPWSFQQYAYLLPRNRLNKLNTLWLHKPESGTKGFLQNIIGIVVTRMEQNFIKWTSSLYQYLRKSKFEIGENMILFVLCLEKDNQLLRVLPPSILTTNVVYQWTSMVVSDSLGFVSLN